MGYCGENSNAYLAYTYNYLSYLPADKQDSVFSFTGKSRTNSSRNDVKFSCPGYLNQEALVGVCMTAGASSDCAITRNRKTQIGCVVSSSRGSKATIPLFANFHLAFHRNSRLLLCKQAAAPPTRCPSLAFTLPSLTMRNKQLRMSHIELRAGMRNNDVMEGLQQCNLSSSMPVRNYTHLRRLTSFLVDYSAHSGPLKNMRYQPLPADSMLISDTSSNSSWNATRIAWRTLETHATCEGSRWAPCSERPFLLAAALAIVRSSLAERVRIGRLKAIYHMRDRMTDSLNRWLFSVVSVFCHYSAPSTDDSRS